MHAGCGQNEMTAGRCTTGRGARATASRAPPRVHLGSSCPPVQAGSCLNGHRHSRGHRTAHLLAGSLQLAPARSLLIARSYSLAPAPRFLLARIRSALLLARSAWSYSLAPVSSCFVAADLGLGL
jgi:hypothetical protein